MFVRLERFPNVLGIRAGSLDDPTQHKPSMDLFTESPPPMGHDGTRDKEVSKWAFGLA